MFVHEPQITGRKESQAQTDKLIKDKLGSSNFVTKVLSVDYWNCYWSCNKFF